MDGLSVTTEKRARAESGDRKDTDGQIDFTYLYALVCQNIRCGVVVVQCE